MTDRKDREGRGKDNENVSGFDGEREGQNGIDREVAADKVRFSSSRENELSGQVEKKVARRLKARRTRNQGVFFGLGMFGLVGWTIAIYTILGIILGSWLDRRWPLDFSWTLTLLFIGLIAGLLNAWRWIKQESLPHDEEDEEE